MGRRWAPPPSPRVSPQESKLLGVGTIHYRPRKALTYYGTRTSFLSPSLPSLWDDSLGLGGPIISIRPLIEFIRVTITVETSNLSYFFSFFDNDRGANWYFSGYQPVVEWIRYVICPLRNFARDAIIILAKMIIIRFFFSIRMESRYESHKTLGIKGTSNWN